MSYTVEFIIMAVLFSMVLGGFMAMCIVNTIAENSKPVIKWIMGIINCGCYWMRCQRISNITE